MKAKASLDFARPFVIKEVSTLKDEDAKPAAKVNFSLFTAGPKVCLLCVMCGFVPVL